MKAPNKRSEPPSFVVCVGYLCFFFYTAFNASNLAGPQSTRIAYEE
jgi:hypothetical protein